MLKKLTYEKKEMMVKLSGACFWYWNSFHSFLDSSGVPSLLRERYPRESFNKYEKMRNILNDLEVKGDTETIDSLISNFFKLSGPIDPDFLDVSKAISLLEDFRILVGNDPIELEIQRKSRDKAREVHQESIQQNIDRQRGLDELNETFTELVTSSNISPQKRGFELERLFFELLSYREFDFHKPYRTNGEQIDGHFRYEKFDYLVEAKWTTGLTNSAELSVFDGKIKGKAQSTRGFFLSANGFGQNAISKFTNDAPRIVLMTGEDLALVLNGHITFDDAMKAKIDAIVRKGEILLPLSRVTK